MQDRLGMFLGIKSFVDGAAGAVSPVHPAASLWVLGDIGERAFVKPDRGLLPVGSFTRAATSSPTESRAVPNKSRPVTSGRNRKPAVTTRVLSGVDSVL